MLKVFGAWAPDRADVATDLTDALNVIPYADFYGPFPSAVAISSALPAAPAAAISSSVIGGTTTTYAATAASLYKLAVTSWTDISGAVYVAETPGVWGFAQYRDRVLACSYNNLLQQVQVGSVSNFASIANSPQGRVIGVIRDFVFVGDINDPTDGPVPERVRWNAIDDPLSFPLPGTAGAQAVQADENDLRAESGAVTGIFGSGIGVILQERAVVRAEYVGAPTIFRFDEVDTGHGMTYRGAAAQAGRVVYYLSENGFYATDGSSESEPIGHGIVDRWFLAAVNPGLLSQVRAVHDPIRSLILWTFPSLGSSTNDSEIHYNYVDKKWARASIGTSGVAFARTSGVTLEGLDTYGTLETISEGLDSPYWIGGKSLPSVFTADYRLASLSGTALAATLETGELLLDGRRSYVNGIRPLVSGGSSTVTMGTRKLMSDPVTWGTSRAITAATGIADFRSSAHFQRVRVSIPSGFEKAHGIDALVAADDGQR